MNEVGHRLLNEANYALDDKAQVFYKLLPEPEKYLNWCTVEMCMNNPALYEFEIIDHTNKKVNIDRYTKAWVTWKTVQDHSQLCDHISHGHTFIITNYGFFNQHTQELLKVFESCFNADCAIHVYGGKDGAESFKIHDDYPSNFIIQVEGTTEWKVFKNRCSSLLPVGDGGEIREDMLEVDMHVTLEPGDALYIPSRAYHCAYPTGKRLSMSIPCWTRFPGSNQTSDRNWYPILWKN